MIHENVSPLAGQTVKLKNNIDPPIIQDNGQITQYGIGGKDAVIEDWWDRVSGKCWTRGKGNLSKLFRVELIYAFRAGYGNVPLDDEVLYVKIDGLDHLVHINELEIES